MLYRYRRKNKAWRLARKKFLRRSRLCCEVNRCGKFCHQWVCKDCIEHLKDARRKTCGPSIVPNLDVY